jgi:predicted GNAT family acetyltransferase
MSGTGKMETTDHTDVERFLGRTRSALESNEAANSLMLGICGHLIQHPQRFQAAPCLKTVDDGNGLVLAALMTPPHNLVVYGHQGDLVGGARLLIQELVREGWSVPGVLGPSQVAQRVATAWTEITGQGHCLQGRQQVFELRDVIGPLPERGRLRPATKADVPLVTGWRYAFHHEVFGEADQTAAQRAARERIGAGDVFLWEDKQPVSMAMKTRPTRNGISLTLVYTPPALRGRGYATACVGALSRLLLDTGWAFCALFADVANLAANRVYERVGYRPVCEVDEILFSAGDAHTVLPPM